MRCWVFAPLVLFGCDPPASPPPGRAAQGSAAAPIFLDVAKRVGLDFEHDNGMSGELYICEMMGAGCALFDFDNDGDLDAFLVQGGALRDPAGGDDAASSLRPSPKGDRLFRNELTAGGDLRFRDATEAVELDSTGYGMGAATGDVDNDGWVDLYVTNFGPNRLFRNVAGKFHEATPAGADDPRWSTSASFFDYDRDGNLDLFVCNYIDFRLSHNKTCYASTSARDYCSPLSYDPVPDRLLKNLGGGSFEDVSVPAQIAREYGNGLGVVTADFTGDGWPDIYVANDGTENLLWVNGRDGSFRNEAVFAGCALNGSGQAEASMGVAAADADGDGDEDLFMTHLRHESNTLYLNAAPGRFDDSTAASALAAPSRPYTGFGTAWIDIDNDGGLDLAVANGAVTADPKQTGPFPLKETNLLFRQVGRDSALTFQVIPPATAGPAFAIPEVSRGLAAGDVDNDGDVDLLVTSNHGPARLLQNQVGNRQSWIGFELRSAELRRHALGSRVEVKLEDGRSLWRRAHTDGSYGSASDPRIHIGLGRDSVISQVRVHWWDGTQEDWPVTTLNRWIKIIRE